MTFKSARFGDILSEPVRNGIYKKKEFHGQGAKIVNMGEIFAHPRLRAIDMRRVVINEKEKARATLQEGDLLFARRSLVAEGAGKCSIVMNVDEATTFESSIIRARIDAKKHEPLFFYYFFQSPLGRETMRTILRQVAVSGITGSDLVDLRVPTPRLHEQREIAATLGRWMTRSR